MKDKITQIRSLLDSLEGEANNAENTVAMRMLSGLEFPDIMRDVVDLLMPLVGPYEASFYVYLLRHSIIEHGSPMLRVGVKRLQQNVIRNAYAGTRVGGSPVGNPVSYKKVTNTLQTLQAVGAIRREADPNKEGTLYRLLLPEEIEACRERRNKLTAAKPVAVMERDSDYYNVRENRVKVYERDNYRCQYCDKQLTHFTVTLDHITPIAEGGDNCFENLLTACLLCNSKKNARSLGDFMAEKNPA